MQEITREPWTVRKTSHGYVVEHNFKTADGQADAIYVAVCANYSPNVDDEANAHFIAASPNMFDALVAMTARYVDLAGSGDCGFWNPEEELQVIQARAAIAKAKGELL